MEGAAKDPLYSNVEREHRGACLEFSLPAALVESLQQVAQRQSSPIFTVLLAGWVALLGRWLRQEELDVGGMRLRFDPEASFSVRALIERLNRHLPGQELVVIELPPDAGSVLEERKGVALATFGYVSSLGDDSAKSEVGLSIGLRLEEKRIDGVVEFSSENWNAFLARQLITAWETLLEAMANNSDESIYTLPLVDAGEPISPPTPWSEEVARSANDRLIHELFEAQAERSPTAVALIGAHISLSYEELNAQANVLAHNLRERGLTPEQLVGLYLPRGIEMVVGLLAILKAGGAYVPLDPAYPRERLARMVEIAQPRLILTLDSLRGAVPSHDVEVVAFDGLGRTNSARLTTNLRREEVGLTPGHLAYVIFTSGSTGEPKGALNEHRGMVNRLCAQRYIERFSDREVCCQKTSISFVDSLFETLGPLCAGRPLVVIPPEVVTDLEKMAAWVASHGVTSWVTVPSLARSLSQSPRVMQDLGGLRQWILSGEEVPRDLIVSLQRQLPHCELLTWYGSSEVSSDVACYRVDDSEEGRVPIGRPVPNVRVYILDERGEPVPPGMVGEIYVGGVGVGRGYLNRPELTQARFLSDRFSSDPTDRMYRTGDLGRWRADGNLQYHGRCDSQVKIRGFRIELGEIESQLLRQRAVGEAAVIAREDVPGEKRLVAYLTWRTPGAGTVDGLRAHLKEVLPEYMVPSAFVVMDSLPKTPNGKLNRLALPEPDLAAHSRRPFETPIGREEEVLARIWQQLLRVEAVGRQDNFFELGGHSLQLLDMLGQVRRVGLELTVRDIYSTSCLADLARCAKPATQEHSPGEPDKVPLVELESEQIESLARAVPGGADNIRDIYPLSALQEGLLFHHLINNDGGDAYILGALLSVPSLNGFIRGLQAVIDRHDILRTAFFWEGLLKPIQVVQRHATLETIEVPLKEGEDPIQALREKMQPPVPNLTLQTAPLLRLHVAQPGYVLLQIHHLVCDNESLETLLAEVMAFMEAREDRLPVPVPYRSHVVQSLDRATSQEALEFFRCKLEDVTEPTTPFGLMNVYGNGQRIAKCRQNLDTALARRVRMQARALGVTPATLFHAAWALVISRTSARDDIVFGTVLLGRWQNSASGGRGLGLFINTLPLRVQLSDKTAQTLVKQMQAELLELLSYEQTPLAIAQRASGIQSPAPLFSALLNYIHSDLLSTDRLDSAAALRILEIQEWTNYPIVLSVEEHAQGFALNVQTDLQIQPQRVLDYLCLALESLTEALQGQSPTEALTLEILPHSERRQLLESFNKTRVAYPQQPLAHVMIDAWAEETPESVALVCGAEQLTYGELVRQSDHVARLLWSRSVGPDERVAVYLERGISLVVALLGVLKAGGGYVPLDVNYPVERLEYMLSDSAPRVLLTQESLKDKLRVPPRVAVVLLGGEEGGRSLLQLPVQRTQPSDLAYVIYTSGSTGRPKGVCVEHRTLLNLIQWHCDTFNLERTSRCSAVAAVGFDAAGWEIWPTLCAGATLVVTPPELGSDTEALLSWWQQTPLDVSFLPTPIAELVFSRNLVNPRLQTLLVGGDRLRNVPQGLPYTLVNNYGPTECTVVATSGVMVAGGEIAHIGRPIANTQIYLLDPQGRLVPRGVTGELYIGGGQVARGYLNRPELTAERFVSDAFSREPQALLYRSGDLGRWTAEGNIEFLGRTDEQVKVRGVRIELGEIEAQLLSYDFVNAAAVVAREDAPGARRLVAYLVLAGDRGVGIDHLRRHLQRVLPEYMVPNAFVLLEKLPLTANGKLDRKALPAPDHDDYAVRAYEAPKTQAEEILAGIWQELLQVEHIGRQDNFFQLGGHSLLIVQLLERLRRSGFSATPRQVFDSPTLAHLADVLTGTATEPVEAPFNPIPAGSRVITPEMVPLARLSAAQLDRIVFDVPGRADNVQDIYPLAALQEGLLFHHLLEGEDKDTYVVVTLLRVASRDRVEELIAALGGVIDRHDILRTSIFWQDLATPVQVVQRHATLPVCEVRLALQSDGTPDLDSWVDPMRHGMSLRQAPLLALEIAPADSTGQWYALVKMHHIVADNLSEEMVIAEVVAHLEGRADQLPEPVPYRNHIAQSLARAREGSAEAFFREKLGDVDESTAPFGLVDVRGNGTQVAEGSAELDVATAQRIRRMARSLAVSAAAVFHAAWALVVARTSGRDDVVFGSVLLGRLQGSSGAQHVLGIFINTLPVRVRLRGVTARGIVIQTQRELVDLMAYEQTPLAQAQRCSGIEGTAPLFSAVLNFRHSAPKEDARWEGAAGIQMLMERYRTNYPFTLSIDDVGEGFRLSAQTDRSIDPERLMVYMRTALGSLLDALETTPETEATHLDVLPFAERARVTDEFNRTRVSYPQNHSVHEIFEACAHANPSRAAVLSGDESLDYAQLNARANQLAHFLRAQGVGPECLIGVCLPREIPLVVAFLGVLKAGAAYVPLDPDYPRERLQHMLDDAAPPIVLTHRTVGDRIPGTAARLVYLDTDWGDIASFGSEDLSPATSGVASHNAAYVIYTSGSTGAPKGVILQHRGACNLAGLQRQLLGVQPGSRVLQFASLSFDACTWEWLMALCGGGTLCLASREALAPGEPLRRTLSALKITHATLPPVAVASLPSSEGLEALRTLIVAGEACPASLVRQWAPGRRFINAYGPTESTICATMQVCQATDAGNPPIGRPNPNTQIHILDSALQPLPIGVPGEIFIGGEGVARGYLNRPELTSTRFIRDIFRPTTDARLYRTGDVGRWRPDGTIDYLGRNDQQVKLRGYRIELGEIEAQLRQYPRVKEALVLAREETPGDKRLVAYVVADLSSQSAVAADHTSQELRQEIVADWETLYEDTYSAESVSSGPNFVGWNSSYTGEPIPEEQMHEWLNCALSRIQALNPKRVLEIGCGMGLYLQHLAPRCPVYVATDISRSAIEQLRRWAHAQEALRHVRLLHRSATDLHDFEPGSFDTVVLNSVVQYFPDVDYLLAVIGECIRLLSPGGTLFLGDIRHLGLLPIFQSAVQLGKAGAAVTVGQLKRRIARAISHEKELLVEPDFFAALPGRIPGIQGVEIQLKRGVGGNELTRYRYDVVLRTGRNVAPVEQHSLRAWGDGDLNDLRSLAAVRVKGIPNARLARDFAAYRLIQDSDERLEVGVLRRQLKDQALTGEDPEVLRRWAQARDLEAHLTWNGQQPDQFDLEWIDPRRATTVSRGEPERSPDKPWHEYANNPSENNVRQRLVPELRDHLKRKLPDYMIPAAWVVLKQLPLTPNGKIDRRALPTPQARPDDAGEYVAPRNDLERQLARIWEEVLRVDQVGIQDNFFDLGGQSLLVTQVTDRIQSALSVDVPMKLLFESPTIELLSAQLERRRETHLLERIAGGEDDIRELLLSVASMPEARVQELMRDLNRD